MMKTVKIAVTIGALLISSQALAQKAGQTRAEAQAASAKKFRNLDADGNGKGSPTELLAFMTKAAEKRGETMDQAKVDRRLKRLDTDGDGNVSAAELAAEDLAKFDKADVNRNGVLDADEAQ
ncbi:EF-hand domain-containing protein [Sphingomonas kyeonggiensis]|uniref:Ca2+-binding EF-hand superfamily protein n=1 Tax=Sphingomonas kyeonggiensis TaxID=1268553 RepID=A0A7W6JXQ6_9SPHN|nr:EF-hand domain-containing protein [Sphingomonas kyeonggiensis]MBB4100370.1 Ca2+-binding EF-hand superfamily protein [Sphingomonas kyeonggiensis]